MKTLAGTKLAPVVEAVRARAEERRRALPLVELERRVAELVRERGHRERAEAALEPPASTPPTTSILARASEEVSRVTETPRADGTPRERFLARFAPGEFGLICELKRRSPSAGPLLREDDARPHARYLALGEAYAKGGAAAFSVLTERDHFDGGLEDLARVAHLGVPRLRKDFVLDAGMVLESALHGADALLLIAAILDDAELRDLRQLARELGLAVLLEVHDEAELERALPHAPELLGVNARDLRTLVTDLGTVERLLPRIPRGPSAPLRVAESGLRTAEDLLRVRAAGADAALVGESLVRSSNALSTLLTWKAALDGARPERRRP